MRGMLLVGMLVVVGCGGRGYDPDMPDASDVHTRDWNANLSGVAGTQIGGSSNVQSVHTMDAEGNTAAAVRVTGAPSGGEHPWHIHTGTCAAGGGIVGETSAYPLLRPGSNGSAAATANLTVGLDPDAQYHVNIHRSPSDLTVVACGDLAQ